MKITLEKGFEKKQLETGNAYYVLFALIPYVGIFITLILAIMRKQFKGAILNNILIAIGVLLFDMLLILLLFGFISILLMASIQIEMVAFITLFSIALSIFSFILIIIYFFVYSTLNLNYLSLKKYLEDGYVITSHNKDYREVQLFVQRANEKKKPWFFILKI